MGWLKRLRTLRRSFLNWAGSDVPVGVIQGEYKAEHGKRQREKFHTIVSLSFLSYS